jgi:hypothetical protein
LTHEGWVEAGSLTLGDQILSLDGTFGDVESISISNDPQVMYNLTVDISHTFAVGEGQWVVHNSKCVNEFDIVDYKDTIQQPVSGERFEKHHGLLNIWATANLSQFGYTQTGAPAIVLTRSIHNLTREWFNNWRIARTGSFAGTVDWSSISFREANQMAMEMFRYAQVPEEHIQSYFRELNRYLYRGDIVE